MRYANQEGEFVPQQPRRARERRNTPPSNSYNEICDEKRNMDVKINMLIEKMERKNLISPMASSEDDDVEMNKVFLRCFHIFFLLPLIKQI